MNNDNPPFAIGQRVIALATDNTNGRIVKDKEYTILDIASRCCGWSVDIGAIVRQQRSHCGDCGKSFGFTGGVGWLDSKYFAPIREVRDHKSIAVPEELLVIPQRDTLEPLPIKALNQ